MLALAVLPPLLGWANPSDPPQAAPEAFVSHGSGEGEGFVGEPLRLTLEFGWTEEHLEAGFDPMFLRAMDLQVQVFAPGFLGNDDFLPVSEPLRTLQPALGLDFALGEQIAQATGPMVVRRGEGEFVQFEVTSWLAPRRPGLLELAAPTLRYRPSRADATDGERPSPDLGPVVEVRGSSARWRIRDVPPSDLELPWSGFVGSVALELVEFPTRVVLGEPFALRVRVVPRGFIAGASPPLDSAPPDLEATPGFDMIGAVREASQQVGSNLWRYELVAREIGDQELAGLRWAVFDPRAARHELLSLGPLAVRVEALPAVNPGAEPEGTTDSGGGAGVQRGASVRTLALGVGALVLALGVGLLLRRRTGPRG